MPAASTATQQRGSSFGCALRSPKGNSVIASGAKQTRALQASPDGKYLSVVRIGQFSGRLLSLSSAMALRAPLYGRESGIYVAGRTARRLERYSSMLQTPPPATNR